MKVKKIITQELDLEITEATLLAVEEAEHLPERLRRYERWWWLKSHGSNANRAVIVTTAGCILDYGYSVNFGSSVVRPTLIISNLESSDFKIGDIFEFGGKEFEIVSNDKALCLGDIGNCAFRKDWEALDSNEYLKSDVKKYIDNWFERVKKINE